jgi:hypothetical protein
MHTTLRSPISPSGLADTTLAPRAARAAATRCRTPRHVLPRARPATTLPCTPRTWRLRHCCVCWRGAPLLTHSLLVARRFLLSSLLTVHAHAGSPLPLLRCRCAAGDILFVVVYSQVRNHLPARPLQGPSSERKTPRRKKQNLPRASRLHVSYKGIHRRAVPRNAETPKGRRRKAEQRGRATPRAGRCSRPGTRCHMPPAGCRVPGARRVPWVENVWCRTLGWLCGLQAFGRTTILGVPSVRPVPRPMVRPSVRPVSAGVVGTNAGRKDLVRLTGQAVSLTPVRLTSWFDRVSLTA